MTIESVRRDAGGVTSLRGFPRLEMLVGRVNAEQLARLRTDLRIAQISAATMGGEPAATLANTIVNFPLVWNSALGPTLLRGQGAAVVVMDTGMQTDLDWFGRAFNQGATRVTRQRCFSTTGFGPLSTAGPDQPVSAVSSVCPLPQNSTFDSAGANSGHFTLATCPYSNADHCHHGSQVAALAAGQKVFRDSNGNWFPSHRSGATEADIWAYTVFSRSISDGAARFAVQDMTAALDDVWLAANTWSAMQNLQPVVS
jgi:hypothetical protein